MKKTHKTKSLLIKKNPVEYESLIDNCKNPIATLIFKIFLFMPDVVNSIGFLIVYFINIYSQDISGIS